MLTDLHHGPRSGGCKPSHYGVAAVGPCIALCLPCSLYCSVFARHDGRGRIRTCAGPRVEASRSDPLSYAPGRCNGRAWDRTRDLSVVSGALIPLSHSTVALRAGSQTRTGIPALEAPCLCLSTMPAWHPGEDSNPDLAALETAVLAVTPPGWWSKWPAGLEPAPPGPQPGALPLSYGHGLRNVMASEGFEPTCRGRMRAAEPQAPPAAREGSGEGGSRTPTARGHGVTTRWAHPCPCLPERPPGRIRTCA